jgi:hypothetical protein
MGTTVQERIDSINVYDFDDTLDNVIKKLSKRKNDAEIAGYTNLVVTVDYHNEDSVIELWGDRRQTSKELRDQIEQENEQDLIGPRYVMVMTRH